VELVREIHVLKDRGNTLSQIAGKIDLDISYIRGILQLLDRGEDRLLQAVEKGQLPISIAITIATSDDKTIQRVLQEAYERKDLRGKALLHARQLIEGCGPGVAVNRSPVLGRGPRLKRLAIFKCPSGTKIWGEWCCNPEGHRDRATRHINWLAFRLAVS
jgi:RepB plasmid partitioning protein